VELSLDSEYDVAASTIELALEIFSAALLYQGQDHGDHALAVRKAAASDGEEGFHPRNRYRCSHLRPLDQDRTLPLIV
jgi:hypothetical protein